MVTQKENDKHIIIDIFTAPKNRTEGWPMRG